MIYNPILGKVRLQCNKEFRKKSFEDIKTLCVKYYCYGLKLVNIVWWEKTKFCEEYIVKMHMELKRNYINVHSLEK